MATGAALLPRKGASVLTQLEDEATGAQTVADGFGMQADAVGSSAERL